MYIMKLDKQTGLVLEGGGMRGVFTSGVLDSFMNHNLYFNYVVSVSAGACNGLSYMSHQPKRAKYSNIDMLDKYQYIGIKYLVTQRSIFDQDLLYDKFPNEVLPFDFDAYFGNPDVIEMVTTNCHTGRACYLSENKDKKRLLDVVKASSSLPYVSRIVMVDGEPMLDGGIVDSIPVLHAMECGHHKNVVVLTRNRGYRESEKDIKIPSFFYKNYPRLRVVLSHRCECYNRQLELVEQLEDKGQVICIRPQHPLEVGRIEKDVKKLEALYEHGLAQGEAFFKQIEI
jgi:predicted patatin/cPLA2 family phospholipase